MIEAIKNVILSALAWIAVKCGFLPEGEKNDGEHDL